MSYTGKQDLAEALDIAIIGMAGRFPGARNLEQFWQNLRDGVESISFFTDQEVAACGVNPAEFKDPCYVKAGGVLDEVESFDAIFFGFYPREAEIMDPQHRVFLESAWEAMENAGYDSESYPGLIGVYAGTGANTYLMFNLLANREVVESVHAYHLIGGNDKDFLPTRVSYKLNLKGPSVGIQTACSTSLVAVALACQGLLNYQCDIALAFAVNGCGSRVYELITATPNKQGEYYMSIAASTLADKNKALTRRLFNGRTVRFPMLLFLIFMALILAISLQPRSVKAQAASTTIKFSDSFPFSFFNDCTGEIVSGVVQFKTTIHITTDANGGFHAHFHDVFHGTAVGETSGTQYVGPQTDHDSFNASSGGALEETFTLNFRFLSQGSADNILTHILFHITITPNGNVTSEIFNITQECRG
jgi:Beta-ketoacyl synthase, N-terminal domain